MSLVQGPGVSICIVRADDPKEMLPFLLEFVGPGKQIRNEPMRPLTVEPFPIDTSGIVQDTVQPLRLITEEDIMEPDDPGLLPESR